MPIISKLGPTDRGHGAGHGAGDYVLNAKVVGGVVTVPISSRIPAIGETLRQ